jgi:hypothetical protein
MLPTHRASYLFVRRDSSRGDVLLSTSCQSNHKKHHMAPKSLSNARPHSSGPDRTEESRAPLGMLRNANPHPGDNQWYSEYDPCGSSLSGILPR